MPSAAFEPAIPARERPETCLRPHGHWDRLDEYEYIYVSLWRCGPTQAMASFLRFLDHTQRHTAVCRTFARVINPSQRPLPDNTQHSQQTDIHTPGGIRTHIPSKRAAANLRLRQRGHWDRLDEYK
jgi:hypothetical protein